MSQTEMNSEDLISGDVVLRYYCICCLEHNGPFIRIAKCVHSGFLKKFPLPDFNPSIPEVVCLKCHNTLRKINNFEKQVQESYSILLEMAQFQNEICTKSNLTISKVEHLDISENEIPQTNAPNMPFKNTKNIETALNIINTNTNSLQSTHLKSFSDTIMVLANEHLNLEPTRNTVLPATSSTNLPREKYIIVNSSKRKVVSNEIKDFLSEKRKNLNTTANIDDKTNSVDNKPDLVADKVGFNGIKIKEELVTDDFNEDTTDGEDTTLISYTKIHKKVTKNNTEVKTEIDSLNNEIVIPMDIKIESEEEVVIDHVYGTNVLSKDIKMEPDDSETDRAESLERNEANDFTMDDSAPITSQTINYKELQEERENKLKSKEFLKWPHRCDSCIIGFQFKENLDDHNKRKHEMREGHVSCKICRQAVDVDYIDDHTSAHYKRTAYNRTMEKQPDEPEDFTNEPLPSMSEPMAAQDAVASTLATPFAQPKIAASKSKAQKQREYRQRIAASRTPAQAAAARRSKNERQRKNRLRQATNLAIVSGSLEATTPSSCSGEESNNVQTISQHQHAQQQFTTTADQADERVNLTNEPLFPAIPVHMEVQEAVASTSATPFAKPITAAPKTRAQIQREYRQRIAASRTPAQAAAARKLKNERQRNNRLRQSTNLGIASGFLEATSTSSSRSGQRLNTVHIDTRRQFTDQHRQTLATEPAETTVQPSTSSDQIEIEIQID